MGEVNSREKSVQQVVMMKDEDGDDDNFTPCCSLVLYNFHKDLLKLPTSCSCFCCY